MCVYKVGRKMYLKNCKQNTTLPFHVIQKEPPMCRIC